MSGERPSADGASLLDRFDLILDAIEEAGYLTLTGVMERTGLARSTAHRLLLQMERRQWLFRVGTNYELGPRLFDLGTAGLRNHWFYRSARPALHWLHVRTGCLVHLAFLRGTDVVFWDKIGAGAGDATFAGQIGGRAPASVTALGKALLAGQPPGVLTAHTLAVNASGRPTRSRADLLRELEEIRHRGYAWDREEFHPGVGCLATVVHANADDPSSAYRTTAAISLCVPVDRLDARLVAPLMTAKTRITQAARVNPMIDRSPSA
ncbi:IclR family transcriptional regulator [Dietzia sp. CH92]|uniref:IclR family transcriptional regulator n=1 Tax=Dietzia sp. CH92 TaxID=3051823 RepID=UPI0028D7DEE2|nr:IclR family transcriptional regulator [Dietzia sp. CH92]